MREFTNASELMQAIEKAGNPSDAVFLQRFFKTGPGQYGEGDIFVGVRVPKTRELVKQARHFGLADIDTLLQSPIHEHRLAAVIIMADQSKKANPAKKKELYEFYLAHTNRINNWDIIDVSCRDVVGGYLENKSREKLYELAGSASAWERRIAIVSTWQFIRKRDVDDTFKIAELLMGDKHDLIRKATGWMLREAGKKDEQKLMDFLNLHAAIMPRTMLRYAIEKLHPTDKAHYMLAGKV